MPTLSELLTDLDDEYAEVLGLLGELTPEDPRWDRATPAAGWAVRDQISHLAFFDDAGRRAVEVPEVFAREAEAALAAPRDPMETHLVKGRSMSGDQLLAWWAGAHTAMVRALSGADPDLRLPWYGPPMGVLSFVSARLMETWAHGQDVADALGVERQSSDRLRHVAHLGVRARPFSYAVRGRDAPPGPIDVRLVAPSGGTWAWQVGEEVTGTERTIGGPAGGRSEDARTVPSVSGTALDFCLVVTQRRNVADTELVIVGDGAVEWMSLAQAFAGPPGPGRPPRRGNA
jgi:uncharacterized protein (TIGR03084 family)